MSPLEPEIRQRLAECLADAVRTSGEAEQASGQAQAQAARQAAEIEGLLEGGERLALRGREWRLGGRLLYAEESPLQRIVLVEREGSLELFIDGELQFRVEDDGLGFEPARVDSGTGLSNLADRLSAVGGSIRIDSSAGHGTRTYLIAPSPGSVPPSAGMSSTPQAPRFQ